ncbi:hypothetical protein [Psychroserpens sp. NJDZ02]|uniref:hypothetical protein n=1 Tax=Psychroserpens sp. NJDZ02 TaxID=2570561 RepID=UPI0010A8E10B|nr:hypothetical protein [Psychroserpens sp. NJDZ02]QCE42783.1 hypothetical protein E9099_15645 [Psychroserpens sp. NJDZ02]
MKLIEFKIESDIVKIERNFFGNERVFVNELLVSKKRTLFGTNHNIKIGNLDYEIKYTVKDWWKKWTGKPTFLLLSGETVISEYKIKNSMFFSIQFTLSLIVFYGISIIVFAVIDSAKRGFVFNAH